MHYGLCIVVCHDALAQRHKQSRVKNQNLTKSYSYLYECIHKYTQVSINVHILGIHKYTHCVYLCGIPTSIHSVYTCVIFPVCIHKYTHVYTCVYLEVYIKYTQIYSVDIWLFAQCKSLNTC